MSAALEESEFEAWRAERRGRVLAEVQKQGLLGANDRTLSGQIPAALVAAAKRQSGIGSDAELLLYAVSKVALEDDFGWKLLELKGTIPADVDLEFF
jgi:hypothetical protein